MNTSSTFLSRDAILTGGVVQNLEGNLVHSMFVDRYPLPAKQGTKTVKFRRFPELTALSVPVPLTEGVTPTADNLTKVDIEVSVQRYGGRIELTDELIDVSEMDMIKIAAERAERKSGVEITRIIMNEMANSTYLQRAAGAAADNLIANKVLYTDAETISNTMGENKVRPITDRVDSSTGVSTSGIDAAYIGLIAKAAKKDLWSIPNFLKVENYSKFDRVHADEIGTYANIRFIGVDEFPLETGAGAAVGATGLRSTGGFIDLYTTFILGAGGIAMTNLISQGLDAMTKEIQQKRVKFLSTSVKGFKVRTLLPDTMSDTDPLGQRAHVSYKYDLAVKIIHSQAIYKWKHGVSL